MSKPYDREAARAYQREYNRRNRERVDAYRKRYNDEHREEINEKQRQKRAKLRAELEAAEYPLHVLDDAYAALYRALEQRRLWKRRKANAAQ